MRARHDLDELLGVVAPDTVPQWRGKPDARAVVRAGLPTLLTLLLVPLAVGAAVVTQHGAADGIPLDQLFQQMGGPRMARAAWTALASISLGPLIFQTLGLVVSCLRLSRTTYVVTSRGIAIDDGRRVRFFELTAGPLGVSKCRRSAGSLSLGRRVRIELGPAGLERGAPCHVTLVGLGADLALIEHVLSPSSPLPTVKSIPASWRHEIKRAAILLGLMAAFPLGAFFSGPTRSEPPDLGRVLEGATRVRVCHTVWDGTIADVTDRDAVARLTSWLAASEYGQEKCMCSGEPNLEIYRGWRLVATFTLHHEHSLEWRGVWPKNARLSPLATRFVSEWIRTAGATRDVPPEPPETVPDGPCHGDRITSLAFSPDGTLLASGAHDGVVKIWRTPDLLPLREEWLQDSAKRRDAAPVTTGAPRPMRALVAPVTTTAAHRRLARGPCPDGVYRPRPLLGERPAVTAVRFLPDGRHLLVADGYGCLVLWSLDAAEPVRVFEGLEDTWIRAIAVTGDGRLAVTAAWNRDDLPSLTDQALVLWDLAEPQPLRRLPGVHDAVWSLALSLDGTRVGVVDLDRKAGYQKDHSAWISDTKTGAIIRRLPGNDWEAVTYEPSRDRFVFARNDYRTTEIVAHDATTGEPVWRRTDALRECPTPFDDGRVALRSANWIEQPLHRLEILEASTGSDAGVVSLPHLEDFEPTATLPAVGSLRSLPQRAVRSTSSS